MPIRITGMNSGLDTEAIITQLASARSVKVNSLKKAQIKQQYTQDAWKDLNKKIYSFYTDTLSDLQYVGSYAKKKTTVSDSAKATVTTTGTAVNGTQYMAVESLARAAYMTGGKITKSDGSSVSGGTKLSELGMDLPEGTLTVQKGDGSSSEISITADTTIDELVSKFKEAGLNANFDAGQQRLYLSASTTGKDADFSILAKDAGGLESLQKLGLNIDSENTRADYQALQTKLRTDYANADAYAEAMAAAKNTKLSEAHDKWQEQKTKYDQYLADKEAAGDDEEALKALEVVEDPGEEPAAALTEEETEKLKTAARNYYNSVNSADFTSGAALNADAAGFLGASDANKMDGSEAKIRLNGVTYTSKTNNFEINGLSITAQEESEKDAYGNYKEFTLTTSNDSSGIKDMVKNFIKKYNELVNEMSKLYNADANKGYDPLLSEEKSELSDKEIEEWENKVKESVLRKDNTLNNVMSSMVEQMAKGYEVTMNTVNGPKTKTLYLQDFGIDTLGYFKSEANERNAYHINGDEDDSATSSEDDVLGYMIDVDPDATASFFSQLTKGVYSKLTDLMKSTNYSSAYTVYDDKLMRSEYSDYNDKIKTAEDKLNDYLDKWYDRFSKMETAMAQMNSKQSSLSGLFGG